MLAFISASAGMPINKSFSSTSSFCKPRFSKVSGQQGCSVDNTSLNFPRKYLLISIWFSIHIPS